MLTGKNHNPNFIFINRGLRRDNLFTTFIKDGLRNRDGKPHGSYTGITQYRIQALIIVSQAERYAILFTGRIPFRACC